MDLACFNLLRPRTPDPRNTVGRLAIQERDQPPPLLLRALAFGKAKESKEAKEAEVAQVSALTTDEREQSQQTQKPKPAERKEFPLLCHDVLTCLTASVTHADHFFRRRPVPHAYEKNGPACEAATAPGALDPRPISVYPCLSVVSFSQRPVPSQSLRSGFA